MIDIEPLSFTPVPREQGTADGQPLYRLSAKITPPWASGFIELRFPEVVESSMGYHYIDHYRTTLAPISEPLPFPQWSRDDQTGKITYTCTLTEGLEFSASAIPGPDQVHLHFSITNHTGQVLESAEANHCLCFETCPEFYQPYDLSVLYGVLDGQYKSLADTTPTPQQIGRGPWLVLRTSEAKDSYKGPRDTGTMWWLVDQVATENLMAVESKDKKYLAGYTWDTWPAVLMTNGEYPCLHTGSGKVQNLAPGNTAHFNGKIYLIENDPEKLLNRYLRDQQQWHMAKEK